MLHDSKLPSALTKKRWLDRAQVQQNHLSRILGAVLAAALILANPGWAES